MKTMILATAVALFPFAALAHDGIAVKDAFARGANPKSGAAFMLLENHRKVDCTLSGVSSQAAERVELHNSVQVEGVMKMQPVEGGITIPAEGEYLLKRGGTHVMLIGLQTPLKDGMSVPITLDFGDCGTETVEVPVDNQRSSESDSGEHSGHKHH